MEDGYLIIINYWNYTTNVFKDRLSNSEGELKPS